MSVSVRPVKARSAFQQDALNITVVYKRVGLAASNMLVCEYRIHGPSLRVLAVPGAAAKAAQRRSPVAEVCVRNGLLLDYTQNEYSWDGMKIR